MTTTVFVPAGRVFVAQVCHARDKPSRADQHAKNGTPTCRHAKSRRQRFRILRTTARAHAHTHRHIKKERLRKGAQRRRERGWRGICNTLHTYSKHGTDDRESGEMGDKERERGGEGGDGRRREVVGDRRGQVGKKSMPRHAEEEVVNEKKSVQEEREVGVGAGVAEP